MDEKQLEMLGALAEHRGLVTKAMKQCGATLKEHIEWKKDQEYQDRLDEIDEEKRDYLEEILIKACEKLNGTVISNMMKTKLACRGYGSDNSGDLDIGEVLIGYGDEDNA